MIKHTFDIIQFVLLILVLICTIIYDAFYWLFWHTIGRPIIYIFVRYEWWVHYEKSNRLKFWLGRKRDFLDDFECSSDDFNRNWNVIQLERKE